MILKAIRDSGMTQLELSARSGVPQPTICRLIDEDPKTRRTVTLPVADRLCEALGLELTTSNKRKKKGRQGHA